MQVAKDIEYCLRNEGVMDWLYGSNLPLLNEWFDLCKIWDGMWHDDLIGAPATSAVLLTVFIPCISIHADMDPQNLHRYQHVAYESNSWKVAFNVTLRMNSVCDLLVSGLETYLKARAKALSRASSSESAPGSIDWTLSTKIDLTPAASATSSSSSSSSSGAGMTGEAKQKESKEQHHTGVSAMDTDQPADDAAVMQEVFALLQTCLTAWQGVICKLQRSRETHRRALDKTSKHRRSESKSASGDEPPYTLATVPPEWTVLSNIANVISPGALATALNGAPGPDAEVLSWWQAAAGYPVIPEPVDQTPASLHYPLHRLLTRFVGVIAGFVEPVGTLVASDGSSEVPVVSLLAESNLPAAVYLLDSSTPWKHEIKSASKAISSRER